MTIETKSIYEDPLANIADKLRQYIELLPNSLKLVLKDEEGKRRLELVQKFAYEQYGTGIKPGSSLAEPERPSVGPAL